MKLVASMPCRNELGRYLEQSVTHALTYCDEVRVLDDGSGDGSYEWLRDQDGVEVIRPGGPGWDQRRGHEGKTRQALLEWTMAGEPTHILAIDADEFIPRGERLRHRIERQPDVWAWNVRVVEVWTRDPWQIRVDGGWKPRRCPLLYRAPNRLKGSWRMRPMRLACPRYPIAVNALRARASGVDLLHYGWLDASDRERRAARYSNLDQGNYHARDHLDSILAENVSLQHYKGSVCA